jgi:hypothetical protein
MAVPYRPSRQHVESVSRTLQAGGAASLLEELLDVRSPEGANDAVALAGVWAWLAPVARVEGIDHWWDRDLDPEVLQQDQQWAFEAFSAGQNAAPASHRWQVHSEQWSAVPEIVAHENHPVVEREPRPFDDRDWEQLRVWTLVSDEAIEQAPAQSDGNPSAAWTYAAMPVRTVDRRIAPIMVDLGPAHLRMLASVEELGGGDGTVVAVPVMPGRHDPPPEAVTARARRADPYSRPTPCDWRRQRVDWFETSPSTKFDFAKPFRG